MKIHLPTSGLNDLPTEWRLIIGYPEDNPLFTSVDVPSGWHVRPITGQSRRSELVNNEGVGMAIVVIDQDRKSASIYVKKSFDGAPMVIGHKSIVKSYSGRPWSAVETEAEHGKDGLKLTDEWALREWNSATPREDIYHVYNVPKDHFVLRKIHSATAGQIAGLFAQNY